MKEMKGKRRERAMGGRFVYEWKRRMEGGSVREELMENDRLKDK